MAKGKRFGDMGAADHGTAREISDGPCDTQAAHLATGRKPKPCCGNLKQMRSFRFQPKL
jgi:hypothetical protein